MKKKFKLKIFQSVQIRLASLGHRPKQSPFNKIQLRIFVKETLFLFSLCAYIVDGPHTTNEYMLSIYLTVTIFFNNIARVSSLFISALIFDFIDRMEKILNGSELKFY